MNTKIIKEVLFYIYSSGGVTIKQISETFRINPELIKEIINYLIRTDYLIKDNNSYNDNLTIKKCKHCPFANTCGDIFQNYSKLSKKSLILINRNIL